MGKLLERLKDPSRSGVYRSGRMDVIEDAVKGDALHLVRMRFSQSGVMDEMARALQFPSWFGRNWDALEDCLTDLSWLDAPGYLLLIDHADALPGQQQAELIDVLRTAARYWAQAGKPFFAVFVHPPRGLELPELFRET